MGEVPPSTNEGPITSPKIAQEEHKNCMPYLERRTICRDFETATKKSDEHREASSVIKTDNKTRIIKTCSDYAHQAPYLKLTHAIADMNKIRSAQKRDVDANAIQSDNSNEIQEGIHKQHRTDTTSVTPYPLGKNIRLTYSNLGNPKQHPLSSFEIRFIGSNDAPERNTTNTIQGRGTRLQKNYPRARLNQLKISSKQSAERLRFRSSKFDRGKRGHL
ncbi:hypothetical protein C8J57DRAFT_1229490 [Mycena rebaudengoi]|nr:hypothetical protein C8J57DRAFT_1229490 [Mycena rebaudengoi]